MPTLAKAYVATSATSPLEPGIIERREPGEFEIRIASISSDLHFDIHAARGDWAGVTYPVVVGHEIAALEDVSLHLKEVEILGVLGQSGSGKSTLARSILGPEGIDGG